MERTQSSDRRHSSRNYESLLWERSEQLSQLRQPLLEYQMRLYEEVTEKRDRRLNLHEQDMLAQKESEYWRIGTKLEEILRQEDKIVAALEGLSIGMIDEDLIKELLPHYADETPQTSRRKRKILEEKRQQGFGLAEIAWDMYRTFGPQTTHLTTGRNRRDIKGNFNTYEAAGEFYFQTADTHGGKVSYGKNGRNYTNAEGIRIRKK